MSDVVRLEQHKCIKPLTHLKNRRYETHIKHCTDKFRQGRYRNSLDFLFAVSHFTNNVTQALDTDDDEKTSIIT